MALIVKPPMNPKVDWTFNAKPVISKGAMSWIKIKLQWEVIEEYEELH
jgi:hypothetical protein